MKKIIDGASYDTTKAEQLGKASHSNSLDFYHWTETLYRSKSGKYFLHGEGGPKSRYSESTGQNNWSGGEKILPTSRKSAMEWAEEHLSGEEYAEIFGDPEEGFEVISVRLNATTLSRLRAWCEGKNRSMTSIIEELLNGFTAVNAPEDVK